MSPSTSAFSPVPVVSGSYAHEAGIIAKIAVLPDEQTGAQQNHKITMYHALFDTGASSSCISDKVISEQRLKSKGKVPMISATGKEPVDVYKVTVGFPLNVRQKVTGEVSGHLGCFHNLRVCQFNNQSSSIDVLIGRDIICHGVLNMSSDGHFTFSF